MSQIDQLNLIDRRVKLVPGGTAGEKKSSKTGDPSAGIPRECLSQGSWYHLGYMPIYSTTSTTNILLEVISVNTNNQIQTEL